MGEDLRRRPARGLSGQPGRQLRRRAPRRECRADRALPEVEPFPDALHGPVTEVALDSAAGREDAAGGGELEEAPQTGGGQAESADLVGVPDAEGAPATGSCLAVAAIDAACAESFASRTAVIKSVQGAMPIEGADKFAMGTGCVLESFGQGVPFVGAAAKPWLLAHGDHAIEKSMIVAAWKRCGVLAGYEKNSFARGAR